MKSFFHLETFANILEMLFIFCGLVGNGVVIWLLGFCVKRSPFSVYLLNLAGADFIFLSTNCVVNIVNYSRHHVVRHVEPVYSVYDPSFLVGLSLLMIVITERCVSVLCPTWYRCHHPKHLSSILCALIWGLGSCLGAAWLLYSFHCTFSCYRIYTVLYLVILQTSLLLSVSSLILLIRVQCSSRKRQPSRLYLTLLLNMLAFLLLKMPFTVLALVNWFSPLSASHSVLLHIAQFRVILNSVVNPIIYFFVGIHKHPGSWQPLQEVLERALMDEEGEEQGPQSGMS